MRAQTTVPSCTIKTTISLSGVTGDVAPGPGDAAQFESEVRMTGDTTFQETGIITLGEGNRIHFSTVGGATWVGAPIRH